MKFAPEQSITHERQRDNYKVNNATTRSSFYRAMGDCPSRSSDRSIDPVNCWGDVPKRPTRFIDLLDARDFELTSPTLEQPITSRRTPIEQQQSTPNSRAHDNRTSEPMINSEKNVKEKNNDENATKSSATTGRERLLEWLRTSQAKRDENNRQVFTRWIDKLESMNKQAAINLNQPPSSMMPSADFQSSHLFPVAHPAFWIGNPMGFVTPATVHNLTLSSNYPPKMCPGFHETNPLGSAVSSVDMDACQNILPETTQIRTHDDSLIKGCEGEVRQCTENGNSVKTNDQGKDGLTVPQAVDANYQAPTYTQFSSPSSVFRGGYYSQPMCFPASSTMYDPASQQMFYYWYFPHPILSPDGQVTYGMHPQTFANFPLVYLFQPNATVGDGVPETAVSTVDERTDPMSCRSSECSCAPESISPRPSDEGSAVKSAYIEGQTPSQQSQHQLAEFDHIRGVPTALDFDLQKWCSVLNDIAQTPLNTQ